ncbi:hypothetical protein E2C01_046456 [Portunus trituberculatus]|uniref:Integrase p58-like C-terminal domain-containing protein n=1 Tax=Portunus trituberculatus TaxID=210409 RepID=A0A5B7G578_PORTR|nr:hypothetical protein [Portunus trituberculatus]
MEEPCLLGLNFLVQSAACVDLGRMQTVPLILEDAAEQVSSPVTSSDVEDERVELHCQVVREGEVADATLIARGRHAAASSCGGEVDGDAGYASAQMMFGREMQLPLDLVTERQHREELPQTAPEFVVALQQRMETTRRQVSNNLRLAGQAMTGWYQMCARDVQCAVGDRVWLYNPRKKRGLAQKMQSYWEGPYTILQRLSAVTYKLGNGTSRQPHILHVDRLWAGTTIIARQ